jgi:hypothetical protein
MAGNLPAAPGEGSTIPPPCENRVSNSAGVPGSRFCPWLVIAVALTAAVAVAALVVPLTGPAAPSLSTTAAAPAHTAAETAAAQQQLCDMYKLVARAVEVDTGGQDRALARIATTNGAVMLDNAAENPALDAKRRNAAHALAAAYGTLTAMGSNAVATEAQYQATLDDITAKDTTMKKVCGGG